ncbi:hypothetical protein ACQE3E_17665 [Methylomonas sp. MED-D]|uniref:hypothetical protein n=1 Tax=Methylomonas sp. MED-D TaxID=3418768 RepID=UPI003D03167A
MRFGNYLLHAIEQFHLSAPIYKNGNVFVSALLVSGVTKSIDIRFFIEDKKHIIPTKYGIRVPIEELDKLKIIFNKDPGLIDSAIVFRKNSDSLMLKVEDENIDIRFFRDSENFKGWLKKGLRLNYFEFDKLKDILNNIDASQVTSRFNLFSNKKIKESIKTETIGVAKFKLSQKKYENGSFYISKIYEEDICASIDARYFIETSSTLTPTKYGFRIPADYIDHFLEIINDNVCDLNDKVCAFIGDRRILIGYRADRFGEGVDIRYFRESPEYTGWEKSGIRLLLNDFIKAKECFNNISAKEKPSEEDNLFNDKQISKSTEFNVPNKASNEPVFVNEYLQGILDLGL